MYESKLNKFLIRYVSTDTEEEEEAEEVSGICEMNLEWVH